MKKTLFFLVLVLLGSKAFSQVPLQSFTIEHADPLYASPIPVNPQNNPVIMKAVPNPSNGKPCYYLWKALEPDKFISSMTGKDQPFLPTQYGDANAYSYVFFKDTWGKVVIACDAFQGVNCNTKVNDNYTPQWEFSIRSLKTKRPLLVNGGVQNQAQDKVTLPFCGNSATLTFEPLAYASTTTPQYVGQPVQFYELWDLPAGVTVSNGTLLQNGRWLVSLSNHTVTLDFTNAPCATGTFKVLSYRDAGVNSDVSTITIDRPTEAQQNITLTSTASTVNCGDTTPITLTLNNAPSCVTNFAWSANTSSWQVVSNSNTATATPNGNTAATIQVVMTLGSGCTPITRTFAVGLNQGTVNTTTLQFPSTFLCPSSTMNVTAQNSSSAIQSYTWSATGGVTINGSASPVVIPSSANSDTVILASPATSVGISSTITLTVTNICGAQNTVTQNVWIGKPSIPVVNLFVIPDRSTGTTSDLYVCPNKEVTIKFFIGPPLAVRQGVTHYSWQFTCGTRLSTSADTRSILVRTAMAYNPCEEVWLRAHNACGVSDWFKVNVDFASDCGGRLSTNSVRLFSNPSNAHTFVEIDNLPQVNYNQDTENASAGFTYQIKVYDQSGTLRKELSTDKVRKKVITSDLPVGQYRVIVSDEFETTEKILLVNR